MKKLCKNKIFNKNIVILLVFMILLGLSVSAKAYLAPPIPQRNIALSFGWGGYPFHASFSGYESYSNPYMFGPYIGAYPYNAMFDIYSGGYNMNVGYNQNYMGFYNTADFFGSGQRDVNTIGYPVPYALIDQRAWINQMNYASGFIGMPPATGSYTSAGNPSNVYYDPVAYTIDRGLTAYLSGINNFWRDFFERVNSEEEE